MRVYVKNPRVYIGCDYIRTLRGVCVEWDARRQAHRGYEERDLPIVGRYLNILLHLRVCLMNILPTPPPRSSSFAQLLHQRVQKRDGTASTTKTRWRIGRGLCE